MTSGGTMRILFSQFDYLPVHETYHLAFASRTARPLDRYDNILLPFSKPAWVAIAIIVLIFAISFSITHYAYQTTILESFGFHKIERSKINFLLFTVSKLTEPDPLPWFTNKWSAGKSLAMLWKILGLFIVLCYNSNFRAHLTARSFEKSLNTIQDVADNGGVTWFPYGVGAVLASRLKTAGQTHGPLYQIAKKVKSSGTYYDSTKDGGLTVKAIQVIHYHAKLLQKACLKYLWVTANLHQSGKKTGRRFPIRHIATIERAY